MTVNGAYAHTVRLAASGAGTFNVSALELQMTEGHASVLGLLDASATNPHAPMLIEQVRGGNFNLQAEKGDINLRLGAAYYDGIYSLGSSGYTVEVADGIRHSLGVGPSGARCFRRCAHALALSAPNSFTCIRVLRLV